MASTLCALKGRQTVWLLYTLKNIVPWDINFKTYPLAMVNNFMEYYPNSTWKWRIMALARNLGMSSLWTWTWRYDLGPKAWDILGSWATIVWNIIRHGHGSQKLWLRHDVNKRTDREYDFYTPLQMCLRVERLWHFLGSWTTCVWNIIHVGQWGQMWFLFTPNFMCLGFGV